MAGLPKVDVRDFLRRVDDFNHIHAMDVLGLNHDSAKVFCNELEAGGYIEKQLSPISYYKKTAEGIRLSNASAALRIKRTTADRLVAKLHEAIKGSFHDTAHPFLINGVWLFGSYLTSSKTLSDVDVSVEILPKDKGNRHIDLCIQCYTERVPKHARFLEESKLFVHAEQYCYRSLMRALKVSRYISLHEWSETKRMNCTTKRIF